MTEVVIDMAIYGWYDEAGDTPAHDPGVSTPCAVCRRPMVSAEKNVVTISTLPFAEGDENRCYFFRAHKYCWDAATEAHQQELEIAPFVSSRRERMAAVENDPATVTDTLSSSQK